MSKCVLYVKLQSMDTLKDVRSSVSLKILLFYGIFICCACADFDGWPAINKKNAIGMIAQQGWLIVMAGKH